MRTAVMRSSSALFNRGATNIWSGPENPTCPARRSRR